MRRPRAPRRLLSNPQSCSAGSRDTILGIADLLVDGSFPFLGYGTVALGIQPVWNRDFVSGKDWPQIDASRIKIIRHDGWNVKTPWELSRLQFLPVLAKAHLLNSGEQRYRNTAKRLVLQWIDGNPAVGVNWTIAMEVALRAISICLLLNLLWPLRQDEQLWLEKVTRSLWQHSLENPPLHLHSGSKVCGCDCDLVAELAKRRFAADNAASFSNISVVADGRLPAASGLRAISFASVCAQLADSSSALPAVSVDDLAALMFTSGSMAGRAE